MTSETPQITRPVSGSETVLRTKFAESIAGQSELMDKLAQQLITVELAVPGIYVSVLKLTVGDAGTIPVDNWAWGAFGCWFAALILALISLIPRPWKVDPTVLKADPAAGGPLGVEDFFRRTAAYKRRLLIPSALLFAIGLACAAMFVF